MKINSCQLTRFEFNDFITKNKECNIIKTYNAGLCSNF